MGEGRRGVPLKKYRLCIFIFLYRNGAILESIRTGIVLNLIYLSYHETYTFDVNCQSVIMWLAIGVQMMMIYVILHLHLCVLSDQTFDVPTISMRNINMFKIDLKHFIL